MNGKTLAHYEILDLLGRGGMGEVHRARDTKLGRDVALKLLPPDFANDPQRLARFQREARTLASLSHPHIASIHGFEEADGQHFLVMELAEGEDLAARLERGPVPIDDALVMAEQIAEALESAHDSNVVHRDLKPANVKIDPDGNVKLLDFGLARAITGSVVDESDPANSPTITAAFTQEGTILGTAAYMSPEQARGKTVDRRADIWAFGTVLFEMLTGERLFAGETTSDTLASVIKEEPDWDLLPDDLPPVVVALIRRCLEKDPKRRLQSIGEARIAIEEARQGADGKTLLSATWPESEVLEPIGEEGRSSRRGAIAWAVALVVVAVLAFLGGGRLGSQATEPDLRRFALHPEGLHVAYPSQPALSPDGRRIAYFHGAELRIRDLHQIGSVEVDGSEGARAPFWSPDGQWLAFGLRGQIYRVAATGGPPEVVCDVNFTTLDGGVWTEDGTLILAPDSGPLHRVPAMGGDAVPLFPTERTESDYHTPTELPDRRGILFTTHDNEGRETIEVYAAGQRKVLLKIPGARLEYATWSAAPGSATKGYLVYHRMSTNPGVWAAPFDLEALEITGDPILLDSDGSFPSISRDGALLYASGAESGPQQLVIVDRSGEVLSRIDPPQQSVGRFSLSPDGRSVLVEADDGGNTDIWLHDIERGTRTRMTFGLDAERNPGWMSGGQQFYYSAEVSGARAATWVKPVDGTGEAQLLVDGYAVSTVPSSDMMAFVVFGRDTTNDLFYRAIDSDEEPKVLLQTRASEVGPQISPDGRFVIYMSNESGGNEVYMRPFPTGDGKWQISTDGGVWPKWSRAGDEILYRSGAGGSARMMVVTVQTQPTVRLGTPTELFSSRDTPNLNYVAGFAAYEPMNDPDRILMIQPVDGNRGTEARMILVADWQASFKMAH